MGRLDAKRIALLSGVALYPVESGDAQGIAHIRGERPHVRSKPYMAAFNTRRYNPAIKEFDSRLTVQEKSFNEAMTARMRKLVVLLNTLVARNQLWDPSRAT